MLMTDMQDMAQLHALPMARALPARRDAAAAAGTARVLLVDPQPLTRDSVAMWLRAKLGDIAVTTADGIERIASLGREGGVSLLLYHAGAGSLDTEWLGRSLAQLEHALPGVPMALLAADEEWDTIVAALRLGVHGYIPTGLSAGVLVEAIRLLCAGGTYAPVTSFLRCQSWQSPERSPRSPLPELDFSSRQLQIIGCLRRGFANKNIAYQLAMSEGTVKVHLRNIMRKLGAQNRTQIVIMTSTLDLDRPVPAHAGTGTTLVLPNHRPPPRR